MQTQIAQGGNSSTSLDDTTGTLNSLNGRWKVSAKIQQLLNTLKRPKRRPLPEFYEDDDIELELAANPKDPNAPKPEGGPMTPALGDQLIIPSGLPRSLETAVHRYGTSNYKAPAATVLDPNGKMFTTLTYGTCVTLSSFLSFFSLFRSFCWLVCLLLLLATLSWFLFSAVHQLSKTTTAATKKKAFEMSVKRGGEQILTRHAERIHHPYRPVEKGDEPVCERVGHVWQY